MVRIPRKERSCEAVRKVHSCRPTPQMPSSPTMAASLLFVLLVTVFPVPGLSYYLPISGSGLYLETTNSDGYAMTVPPESVDHPGASVFALNFVQPDEPLNLVTLIVRVTPTESPFFVNTSNPPPGEIVFEVTTEQSLSNGVYQFSLILFDPSLGISPPILVDVTVTVASPDMVCELATCSQICQLNGPVDFNCSCIEGYSLQLDGLTCLANDPSPHLLLSHSASLSSLDLKTRSLSPVFELPSGSGSIDVFDYDYQRSLCYYADNSRGVIAQMSLDSPSEEVIIVSQGLGVVSGLAVDWISGNVYYTDSTMDRVYQYHTSSGGVSVVLEGLVNPRAIALAPEPEFRFLFVVNGSDPSNSSVVRAAMNGSGDPVPVATAAGPIADLAVDVVLDRLVVVTGDRSVTSFEFDGRDSESIESASSTESVAGGAVFEDYVYLTYPSSNIVARYNKFPRKEEPTVGFMLTVAGQLSGVRLYHPLQQPATADADECLIANGGCSHYCVNTIGSFYCTCPPDHNLAGDGLTCINTDECDPSSLGCSQRCVNSSTNSSATCSCNPGYQLDDATQTVCLDINECDIPGICSHTCVNSVGGYMCQCPLGLFIAPDQHTCIGCAVNNGGCSQFCVTSTDDFECLCQTGYRLGTDKTSCFPEPVDALLFSATLDSFDNVSIVIRTLPTGIVETILLNPSESGFPPTGVIYGMDVDVEKGFVYYSDRTSSTLMKIPLLQFSSSSDQRQKLLDGVKAWGLAYDWITGYLYWTEDETGLIRRALINGSSPVAEDVISGLHTPRGLAVDPFHKYIYWTESGGSPHLARASLLSSPIVSETLASTGLSSPSGVAIDFLHRRLYWADESEGTIWSSALNGESQTVFSSASSWHPFQLVAAGDSLIVTASHSGGQEYRRLSLISDSSIAVRVVESFQDTELTLHGVAVVDESRQLGNDGQPCPGQVQDCAGGFAGITGTAFFVLPTTSGETLNMVENPIQFAGQVVDDCTLVSGQFLSQDCLYIPIPDGILSVQGNSVIAMNPDSPDWALINSKLVKLTVQCSSPSTEQFCIEFEVSTIDAALTCGFNNGGCTNFCSNPYGPIPVCSCPFGTTLGLDGQTCVDFCNPNPCFNGGQCESLSFSFTCYCADGYTGPLCEDSSQPTCPQDLCADSSPSVYRLDSGDRVEAEGIDDAYCSAITGYCTGEAGQCEACLCKPGLTYRYDTATCADLRNECNFQLLSGVTVTTVYLDNNQFVSVSNGESLPIVNFFNGQSLPSSNCGILALEVNGGDGWMALDASGFFLSSTNSMTTLQVDVNEVNVDVSQLAGQLLKINFTCGTLSDCFSIKVAGGNSDPDTGACDNCLGNFAGLRNLGVPELPRPAANSAQDEYVPLTTAPLQCAGAGVDNCSIISPVQYYDDDCELVSIPQNDLITISGNILTGNNAASSSSSWATITGKLVNLMVTCTLQGNFCVLFRVGAEQADSNADPCDPNPCQNNGTCTSIGGGDDVLCSCPDGYTGPFCSDVDYCARHGCQNGGTCINIAGRATCICPEHTVPPHCVGDSSSTPAACLVDPCNNGGTCLPGPNFYNCTCPTGYTGLHCNTVDPCTADPPVCGDPNATCVPNGAAFYCICPNGEVGASCEADGTGEGSDPSTSETLQPLPSTSSTTTNNPIMSTVFVPTSQTPEPSQTPDPSTSQTLQPSPPTSSASTPIVSSIFVPTSQTPEPSPFPTPSPSPSPTPSPPPLCDDFTNPCLNNGTCFAGECQCDPGITGQMCETNIDDCDPNPCENGATCEDGVASFTCNCVPGYTGLNCSEEINECEPDPCLNEATCQDRIAGFLCICPLGFTGATCETNIDDCDPNPCQNGSCIDGINNFTCDCFLGFTGNLCSENIDECLSQPCVNGRCIDGVNSFVCDCSPGFTGDLCDVDIDDCVNVSCLNGGTCRDHIGGFSCLCPPGFNGIFCEAVCPDGTFGFNCTEQCSCFNGANCSAVDGTCTCTPQYTGVDCRSAICTLPCQNGGTCAEPDFCLCEDSFTGVDCTERECTSTYCANGGTCFISFLQVPTCSCAAGFTGAQCTSLQTSLLGSEGETIGLSIGLFLGVTLATILVVAAMCFFQKTFRPWMKKVKERKMDGKMYTGAAVIHENLAVTESLLTGPGEVANGGLDRPIDNPIYGYLPPQVEVRRTQSPTQPADHTYSTVGGDSPDRVPDTVIVNQARVAAPDSRESFQSPFVPDPLRNSDTEVPNGYQVRASIVDQTTQATHL